MMTLEEIEQLHQTGKLAEAKQGYLGYITHHPDSSDALHRLALLYAEEGDLTQAERYLDKALILRPRDPVISVHLANILKKSGSIERAEATLLEVLKVHPHLAAAYNNLGTVYYSENKWQEAIAAYHSALDIQPDYVDAYYNLGLVLNKTNQIQSAKNTFESLLELAPKHPGANFQLGLLAMQDADYKTAIKYLSVISAAHPNHFETQFNLATSNLKLGKLNEAKVFYLKALQLQPDDTQLLFNLGVVCMQLGQIDQAIDFYLRALKINPNYYEAHNNISIAYLARKDIESALRHFREVLRILPHNEAVEHTINILMREKNITSSPPEYIQSLFDSYADHYDNHLVNALHYKVPALILSAIKKIYPANTKRLSILDIGCGTGLTGEVLKPYAKRLVGVDLSEKMLAVAAEKNLYDDLVQEDILVFLRKQSEKYDAIIAGDVVVYFGELNQLLQSIADSLAADGVFIFNSEISETEDFYMNESGRFAHSKKYITELAAEYGLTILHTKAIVMRTQNKVNVKGILYVLQLIHAPLSRPDVVTV